MPDKHVQFMRFKTANGESLWLRSDTITAIRQVTEDPHEGAHLWTNGDEEPLLVKGHFPDILHRIRSVVEHGQRDET